MIYFIYTGAAPKLHLMARKLMAAADMYLLDCLKAKCEEALCKSLSVENAAELLILGDIHLASQLRSEAVSFINFHAAKVMKTSGWNILEADHPHLMADMISPSTPAH
ncbi:speckle-type POZ protein-like [Denticeps clupeoides]|uniref:speckle-type POZ protein-like n=1 Tax=Denticeps clupeoides TaxID=299321 RepID=UPI0010A5234C|nr:speckle-type POZ protein-like [Denticeps clupeoides]